jgi:hypothetical protein
VQQHVTGANQKKGVGFQRANLSLPQNAVPTQEFSDEQQIIILMGELTDSVNSLTERNNRLCDCIDDFLALGAFGLMLDEAQDAR